MNLRSDYDTLKEEFEALSAAHQSLRTEYAEQMRRANRLLAEARQKQDAASEAHREAEALIGRILTHAPVPALIVDAAKKTVLLANRALGTAAGSEDRQPETMIGRPLSEIMTPEGKPEPGPGNVRTRNYSLTMNRERIRCVSWSIRYRFADCYIFIGITGPEPEQSPSAFNPTSVAASAAHEFNNLLMGIYGNASLMHYDMDPGHVHYESLENILKYVQNGTRLTDQLLHIQDAMPPETRPENPEAFLKTLKFLKADREQSGGNEVPLSQQTLKSPGHVARAYDQISKINRTILLVDDEIMILDVGKKILKKMGAAVLTAQNGHEAIEVVRQFKEKIDLVILDMIMPGMDGEEAFRIIREFAPEMKILLASGYTPKPRDNGILSQNGTDFIQKPFNMIQISKKIKSMLGD